MADDGEKLQGTGEVSAELSVGSGFSLGFVDETLRPAPERADSKPEAESAVPYVLRSLIGVGGQGEVWEAWQSSLQRVVAVKVHRAGQGEQFVREALLTGELDHPSIVPVLDLGSLMMGGASSQNLAMAMKRLRGTRWDELIGRERGSAIRPPTSYLVRHLAILESVCQAVAYAHSKGVLHLDLKPSQIIVGEFGEVYLCDWGMAARRVGEELRFVSPPVGPFGTPGFMAPEQALADLASVGVGTDVYLLGGLVYYIVAGKAPHPGSSAGECIGAARRNVVVPFDRSIPKGLREAVCRSMATAPSDRFAGVEDFRRHLTGAIQRVIQDEEAAGICSEVSQSLEESGGDTYAGLNDLELQVDRAIALASDSRAAAALRDEALRRHAMLAIGEGDLALARVVANRITDEGIRNEVLSCEDAARATLARREAQRVRARQAALGALGALAAVLVVASASLFVAFRRVESEKNRAEAALTASRRELAMANLQAAMSFLDKMRPADARDALRRVPPEWRGWEWGYLASMAVPEVRLLRPRTEPFSALATSKNGNLLGAIRETDGVLVLVDRTRKGTPREEADARWTAVGGGDGFVFAGSAAGGVACFDVEGQRWLVACGKAPITHIAATPSGVLFAADSARAVWRIENGAAHRLLEATTPVTALSADRAGVALGTESGEVWHGDTSGNLVRTSELHTAAVLGIEWHPKENWFVTWAIEPASRQPLVDSRAIVHRVGDSIPVNVSNEVDVGLTAAAWSPDGKRLALAFSSTWLHEMDTEKWALVRSHNHGLAIANGLRYNVDGSRITILSRAMVQVLETQWFGQERVFRADSRTIADYTSAANSLIVCGADGGIAEWATDRAAYSDLKAIGPDRALSIDAAASARVAVAAQQWGWIGVWNLTPPGTTQAGKAWSEGTINHVRVSNEGDSLIALSATGRIDYGKKTGSDFSMSHHWQAPGKVAAIALHPTGKSAVGALDSGGLIVVPDVALHQWQVASEGSGPWSALEFTSDGSALLAGDKAGTISVLDPATFKSLRSLQGHTRRIIRITTSTDSRSAVSASEDESARLWDVATGEQLGVYRGTHSGAVTSAVLTHDGLRVITACDDSIVRVFDRRDGAELVALQQHQFGVIDMDLSADGRRLMTAGLDNTLRIWNALPWNVGDSFFDVGAEAFREEP